MLDLCFYSVGLKAGDRTEVQNEWMQGKVLVIVATISFGMGVDKATVRWAREALLYYFVLAAESEYTCGVFANLAGL